MALQQFAQGFKTGMAPYLSQAFENKAADKDTERKLKYLKQLGAIQLKQKQLEEQMQFEDQLQRLSGVLKGVPGLPQQTPGLLAAGVEPSKVGMEMPLGERGKNLYDLQRMKLMGAIETGGARQATEEAHKKYYETQTRALAQPKLEEDPNYQRLMAYYKMLQEEYDKVAPKRGLVDVMQENPAQPGIALLDDTGNPIYKKELKYDEGKPEEAKKILNHMREIEMQLFGRARPEFTTEPSAPPPPPQEQPLNIENLMMSMYPQYRYTKGQPPKSMQNTEGQPQESLQFGFAPNLLNMRKSTGITSDPEFQKRVQQLIDRGMSREEAEQRILRIINR